MDSSPDHRQSEKAVRLVEYLLRLASLRTKLVRDVADYGRVLWLNDVPRQTGCYTAAWGPDENYESDIWVEVQNRREPKLPSVPDECKDWVNPAILANKHDLPELLREKTTQIANPAWSEGSDQPQFIQKSELIDDHPEIQVAWDHYVEQCWLPWTEEHNAWESMHRVYASLFAIHQEQLRLGEEYELILGLGLLTWQTPSGQCVRRHLIVANALLEFEARLGKFIVRPNPNGASVRPELDMLDIEEQPARAEEGAKASLADATDDPWDKSCIAGVLQALVHSINSQGEYDERLEVKSVRASPKPLVEYAPALVLRKRSARGLTETLKRIKEKIEQGETIPAGFADLAEIQLRSGDGPDRHRDPGETNSAFDTEVFFPKRSNEEQRRIVDKMRTANSVLVQGPPGTGKSHTIANLICHLLATGQRILVTAKTPRALQVLMGSFAEDEGKDDENAQGLIPREIRPLCISLLGSGLEEKRSLECSVGGILRRSEEWHEQRARMRLEEYERNLHALREQKARVDHRLRDIRESETHSHSVAQGTYCGTPARLAEAVNRDRSAYEWLTDTAPLDQTCPISENDLRGVLMALRRFTAEKRRELDLALPEALPSSQEVSTLFQRDGNAIEQEDRSAEAADEQLADHLSQISAPAVRAIRESLSVIENEQRRLGALPYAWMCAALRDITSGNPSTWRELHHVTSDMIASMEPLVHVADETSVDFPSETNIRGLLEDVCTLKEHIDNGGRLGWGPFRSKVVKERVHVLRTVRVNGRPCSSPERLAILADVLRVRVEFEKVWALWAGRCEKSPGPYALQIPGLKATCHALAEALSLERLIGKCRETLRYSPFIREPLWTDKSQIEQLIASCELALARQERRLALTEIHAIETPLAALAASANSHPVVGELLQAIRERSIERFAAAEAKVQELRTERQDLLRLDESVNTLRQALPNLVEELLSTCNDTGWDARIQNLHGAWNWAQARFWIEEYIRKENAPILARRSRRIEDEINTTIAKLASLRAWSFCFSRLTESHRRHMEAWCKHVNSLTKTGRGKRDFRNRQAAQNSLNECKEAVPAWVMPLHRVWDTVDPAPGAFDVIIVDEASQCGVEALPLFYLGKKVLIVGDDKQISPGGEFQLTAPINRLLAEYLADFEFKEYFDVNVSLFAHGKLRCGTTRVGLREHFRCMPEIIRFSNDLCYSDQPLTPLRQYGPERLEPLRHVFVEGGYREGDGNRAVNRPEAQALVNKIVELCKNERYAGKTMGVIVLQGDAQASLIESMLLERLGASEMEKRRLVSGNPYTFQGDERDVIFLSMVAAPDIDGNLREGPTDEQRYNVAASRARDQMWLFHSVRYDDLSNAYLRKRLIGFFEKLQTSPIDDSVNWDDLEYRAAHDNRSGRDRVDPPAPFHQPGVVTGSWFEVDVALVLHRKGYRVIPQFPIAGYHIDLVVEGGPSRLAVECDGDEWHGIDRYEADMERQRILERCGWEFFRVRECAFRANEDEALQGLWHMLEERDIMPDRSDLPCTSDSDQDETASNEIDEEEGEEEPQEEASPSDDVDAADSQFHRRPDEITSPEIQDAILRCLAGCPNRSCTLKSLPTRVLKELRVLTRGNPRLEFEKRVRQNAGALKRKGFVEEYKARNRRIRLLISGQQTTLFE